MSAYNYQRISTQIDRTQANFNKSEQLALKNGFEMVLDDDAYNGRYFIKDSKKWIHNIDALKRQLCTYDNRVLEQYGYDVVSYFATYH